MDKTIVAQSTPGGGAIAMIRMSGKNSLLYLKKLCGDREYTPRKAYYVTADAGTLMDRCVVIYYEAGKSYTGEESAEIFCHGSKVIVEETIKFLLGLGAVLAEKGEFTRRAYENGRLDLTEAEGILDLINS